MGLLSAFKELRNSIAHNNVIVDARFSVRNKPKGITGEYLGQQFGLQKIKFDELIGGWPTGKTRRTRYNVNHGPANTTPRRAQKPRTTERARMSNRRRYIFSFLNDDREGIFRDMTLPESGDVVEFWPSHKNPVGLAGAVRKLSLSHAYGGKFPEAVKSRFYNIGAYPFDDSVEYRMLIPTSSIAKTSIGYLEDVKRKHPNVRLYAWVTDSMHASSPHMDDVRDKLFGSVWDAVLTYDRYDAEEFGFTWFGYTYYSEHDYANPGAETDLYYAGYKKGNREGTAARIYEQMKRGGLPAASTSSRGMASALSRARRSNIRTSRCRIPRSSRA